MPRHILIVEDDALIALSLEQTLEDLGHVISGSLRNLNDGLVHAHSADLDFAFLDFDLGNGTDSLPIAEELTRRGIAFAFASWTDPSKIRASIPNATIITKPASKSEVARALA